MKLYAIPNCDTVKKARTWLEQNGIVYEFHDYKKQGVPINVLKEAAKQLGWEALKSYLAQAAGRSEKLDHNRKRRA